MFTTIFPVFVVFSLLSSRVSDILLTSGVPEEVAANAIRLSVGRHTTLRDVDVVVSDLKRAVDEMLLQNDENLAANIV